MNRINKHNLEPGPYVDEHDFKVVVLDVITHVWNHDQQLEDALPIPLVMARQLVDKDKEEIRYTWPIDIFKEKFKIV